MLQRRRTGLLHRCGDGACCKHAATVTLHRRVCRNRVAIMWNVNVATYGALVPLEPETPTSGCNRHPRPLQHRCRCGSGERAPSRVPAQMWRCCTRRTVHRCDSARGVGPSSRRGDCSHCLHLRLCLRAASSSPAVCASAAADDRRSRTARRRDRWVWVRACVCACSVRRFTGNAQRT